MSADTSADMLNSAEEKLLATVAVPVERHEVVVNGVRLHYLTCGPADLSPRPPSPDGKGEISGPSDAASETSEAAEPDAPDTLAHDADNEPP